MAEGCGVTWQYELKRIRRHLRDPSGNIWSEAFLRHLYNDVQQDFQRRTDVLEDVTAQRVPQLYHFAYQFDWEYGYIPSKWSQLYQCLVQHDYSVICFIWEAQQITDLDTGVTDYGEHFTQPWEAYMTDTPGEAVKMRFPQNLNRVKYIAYDEEPIEATTKKAVQSDQSYLTRTGRSFAYFPYDETDNSYVLYPRPSVSFQNDVTGDGIALYESGDTESDDTGIIATRDDSSPSGSYGASVDIIDTENNVFIVYNVSPDDVVAADSDPDYPVFLRKYVRYGVVARAYGANTDGRIPSLAEYWEIRYTIGVQFTRKYVRSRRNDRNYRLTTKGVQSRRQRRLPRLPDGYPAV